jgi:polyhydroxyalkanoate synthase subunit PhaC
MARPSRTTSKNNRSSSGADTTIPEFDGQKLAENMAAAADIWQRIMPLLAGQHAGSLSLGHTDPASLMEALLHTLKNVSVDPEKLMHNQWEWMTEHTKLWHHMTERMLGNASAPVAQEAPRDKRFKDEAWKTSAWFDYIKQSYLVNAGWLTRNAQDIQGLDTHSSNKLNFFVRQFIDAASPSNYALTNPEVMRTSMESQGDNVVRGLNRLLADLERGDGKLRISMTDESAFELGKTIATAPGKVVFQNELMQLIQYAPTTKTVHTVPVLMTPAWINKYYILDLSPENSAVRWLVDQGYTVFIISWANPDTALGKKRFDDYLLEGPLAALDVIETITGSKKTSLLGYCLGGTLTAITLAYLRQHGQEKRVACASYLTTLIDFSNAGDLQVFIDDTQLGNLENRMRSQGYLESSEMANTFNMLRANDLIWSFVVNHYLLGKDPVPFDLLYWNADATRMPAAMHSYYLRTMYQENKLVIPGAVLLADTPINVTKITTPSYVLATRDDHIAPWMSTYAATQIYDGPVTFTLADSGHVAGVINPPIKNKYCHWVNADVPAKPQQWFEHAVCHEGSWWGHWEGWLRRYSGKQVPARKPGHARYKPIENAPGSYVRVRS